MSIAKRPQNKPATVDQKEIHEFINKGGTPPQSQPVEKEVTSLQLRIPSDLLARVDSLVKSRNVKTPRHYWLLEAIVEKVEREEQKNGALP